jgi:hypothetical protein
MLFPVPCEMVLVLVSECAECWNVLGLDRLIGLIECCNNTTLKIIVDNFKIVIEIIILC